MKTIVIKKQMNHPFKANTAIYRAFEKQSDGSLFNLYVAAESESELRARFNNVVFEAC